MTINFNTTQSGIRSFQKAIETNAENFANIQTKNYKASRANFIEGANGSIEVEIQKIETPGDPLPPGQGEPGDEMSNVDIAEETVDLIKNKSALESNLKVLKRLDELIGNFIDIIG